MRKIGIFFADLAISLLWVVMGVIVGHLLISHTCIYSGQFSFAGQAYVCHHVEHNPKLDSLRQ